MHESIELLGAARMTDLVQEMKTHYPDRYVFFDVPPILSSADALAFVPLVDYVIMVVQAGTTPANDVERLWSLFRKRRSSVSSSTVKIRGHRQIHLNHRKQAFIELKKAEETLLFLVSYH